jgi:transcriptional regulator with XRE-family HTH domain
MVSTSEIIGINIFRILKEKGIMQTELAERLNIPKQTVNKILHGRQNVTVAELKQISEVLNVPMEVLLEEQTQQVEMEPIQFFIENVSSKVAKVGLLHVKNIMEMIVDHKEAHRKRELLIEEWDV